MNNLRRVYRGQMLLTVLMVLYLAGVAVPLNWFWFAPGDLIIANADQGTPPVLTFDRVIHQETRMRYIVVVRNVEGNRVVADPRSAPFDYSPDATLPVGDKLNLDWWCGGDVKCIHLAPGSYYAQTCWEQTEWIWLIFPPKSICVTSNVFTVAEPQPPTKRLRP